MVEVDWIARWGLAEFGDGVSSKSNVRFNACMDELIVTSSSLATRGAADEIEMTSSKRKRTRHKYIRVTKRTFYINKYV